MTVNTLHHLQWRDEQGQEQTFRLVELVSSKWRKLGLELGFTHDQLESWADEFRGNNEKCWDQVMQGWIDDGGVSYLYQANWDGLYKLLKSCKCEGIAIKLRIAVTEW